MERLLAALIAVVVGLIAALGYLVVQGQVVTRMGTGVLVGLVCALLFLAACYIVARA